MTIARLSRGYTMVALLVGITVMSIMIAAVLPMASSIAQRSREDELIFRGLQYAEGIRIFRRRFGRYPNTLREMYEVRPRMVRKLWKDPMTSSENWGLISLNTPQPGTGVVGIGPPSLGGGQGGPTLLPTPTPSPSDKKNPNQGEPVGPILGVYSTSKKKGFRVYDGREAYNEWRFTEQSLATRGAPAFGQPGPGFGTGIPPGGGGGPTKR